MYCYMSVSIIEKRVYNAIELLNMSNKKASIRAIAKILWKEKSLLTIQNAIESLIEKEILIKDDKKQIQLTWKIYE